MPVKHAQEYSQIGVFEYIQQNKGIRYQCNKLAKVFQCDSDDMRDTLDALVEKNWVQTASSGRAKLFFIRTESEKFAIDEMDKSQMSAPAKPYQQVGRAWDTVRERLADFRAGPSLHSDIANK